MVRLLPTRTSRKCDGAWTSTAVRRSPVDERRPESREGDDRLAVGAVGMDAVEPEEAVLLETEHQPSPVRRIRPEVRVRLGVVEVGDLCRMRSVAPNSDDVR